MIRRPFGSIDLNSIRETELHTESRRRHGRGGRESLHSPQLDRERDAARKRAAATRRRETDEARATHTHSNVRVTTAASETEGVAAVSWIESLSSSSEGTRGGNGRLRRGIEVVCLFLP